MDSKTERHSLQSYIQNNIAIVIVTGIALLALVGLIFVAQQSKPGEALYSVKTGGIESTVEMIQFSHKNKAQYQVERLKMRLQEVQELSKQDAVSQEAIADLTEVTNAHTLTLTKHVEASIDSAFPKIDVITTLNEYASVAMAIEILAERDSKFGPFGEHMEDIRGDAVNLYKDRVTSFVQTETQVTVLTYMQESLKNVKDRLGREGVSEEVIDDAENYLDRVATSLQDKKLDRAIFSIGEAYRFIQTEAYTGVLTEEETVSESPIEQNTSTTTEITATTSASTSVSQ